MRRSSDVEQEPAFVHVVAVHEREHGQDREYMQLVLMSQCESQAVCNITLIEQLGGEGIDAI